MIEEKLYPAPGEIEQVYDFIRKYNNDIKKTKDFLGTFYWKCVINFQIDNLTL